MNKKKLFLGLVVVNLFLVLGIVSSYFFLPKPVDSSVVFPELTNLQNQNLSFADLSKFFKELALQKGAVYAFNLLKVAPLLPNIDTHLLGHSIGDILYQQKGLEGIKDCTQDFRNACSHSIVVGLLLEKGEIALPQISEACSQAPGGQGAYTMCYHGLGHGILAYASYDPIKAIQLCQKTGSKTHNFQEYPQCVGGMVMELISGGFHDPSTWKIQRAKFLNPSSPLSICSKSIMPDSARGLCYLYITPYLWEAVEANIGNPNPIELEKAFRLCDAIAGEPEYQKICYGGFGKEFIALAQNRDTRSVGAMSTNSLQKIVDWCGLAKNSVGTNECNINALVSLFWGGENDRAASINFCKLVPDSSQRSNCFTLLTDQVGVYIKDPNYKTSFCHEIPTEFKTSCQQKLL